MIRKLFLIFSFLLTMMLSFSFSMVCLAEDIDIPKTINIQGKLATDSGQALRGKSYSMIFQIYDGSSRVFTTTENGTLDDNGLYSKNIDISAFLKSNNFSKSYSFSVGITIDGKTITSETTNFASNPYAFYASTSTYAVKLATSGTQDQVWGMLDSSGTQGWKSVGEISVSTAIYAKVLVSSSAGGTALEDYNFKSAGEHTYNIKVATASWLDTANKLTDDNFKNPYDYTYNIKVGTAVYVEATAGDLAEIYKSTEKLVPGDVVSIDITKDNSIIKTKVAEDTLVAGIVSTEPGLLINASEKGYKLALVGKVPTKVCNEGGSIKRGDLLVSASLAGYAKKAGDNPKVGTVIGKALESFNSRKGTILVLVNLQ